ncbi:mucin-13 [Tachyglossus aculeatus]|uniref:mucin-13 n=1 Tax=Tachyglossus aculeatus TaxID=9261 RepID=UPI0018F3582A|nr:mucin-13 [Tachyglossus aculeatus]
MIQNSASNPNIKDYTGLSACDNSMCDRATTICKDYQGWPSCRCKLGLSSPNPYITSCTACSSDCIEANNKYCAKNNSQIPVCHCQPGYRFQGLDCRPCDFGYSGINCAENHLLVLTIVGSVGGALLLGTIVALVVLAIRSRSGGKDSERERLINNNMKLETTGFSNPLAGSPPGAFHIPRVGSAPSSSASAPHNPYGHDPMGRRPAPVHDYDMAEW